MTALDVMCYLERLQVRLTLTSELELHYKAPRGVMTRVLLGALTTCKRPLVHLLLTGEDVPLPKGVSLPETDYSRFLTWQTGKVPASAQLMAGPLPEPLYHDDHSPAETVQGLPCSTKCCTPTTTLTSGRPASRYYKRTGLCVACYERTRAEWLASRQPAEEGELRLF